MQSNFNIEQIKLIVGLGNPGGKYENTYHNVGFLFVDYLTKNLPISPDRKIEDPRRSRDNFQFLISKPLKSKTHMNKSGDFVAKTLKKHRIKPKEILIVHDDSDIELGMYKFSFGRGAAGHRGVESIIHALKTKNFWRLRIGIRPKRADLSAVARRAKAGEFVLKKIRGIDKKILEEVFKSALIPACAMPAHAGGRRF